MISVAWLGRCILALSAVRQSTPSHFKEVYLSLYFISICARRIKVDNHGLTPVIHSFALVEIHSSTDARFRLLEVACKQNADPAATNDVGFMLLHEWSATKRIYIEAQDTVMPERVLLMVRSMLPQSLRISR